MMKFTTRDGGVAPPLFCLFFASSFISFLFAGKGPFSHLHPIWTTRVPSLCQASRVRTSTHQGRGQEKTREKLRDSLKQRTALVPFIFLSHVREWFARGARHGGRKTLIRQVCFSSGTKSNTGATFLQVMEIIQTPIGDFIERRNDAVSARLQTDWPKA